MAVTTVLFWVSLILSVIGSDATGELAILHSPDSLKFVGSSTTSESSLKDVICASLGLSVEENSAWDGLEIINPFKAPEAAVNIYIDGVTSLSSFVHEKKHYPLMVDEFEPDTYDAMKHRMKQRFAGGNNNIVGINLSNEDELLTYYNLFGEVTVEKPSQKYQYLDPKIEEDNRFISELDVLKAITKKVNAGAVSADNAVDFYNFRAMGLHALSDYHGPNSMQTKEAKKLLGEELDRITKAFVKAYDGSVLVTAVTTDVAHTRRQARSVSDVQYRASQDSYPEEYAAIFNILLWFGVVFVFTLIAIVYALIDMDPGRDSIIYRMTSTRMKKDN